MLRGSYHNGFAPRDGMPLYPSLWKGCVGAWAPCLGPTGLTLRDWSGYAKHGTLANMTSASDWIVSSGRFAIDFDYTASASRPAIELPNAATIGGSNTATIAMWVNLKTAPANNAALYFEPTTSSGFSRFALFQTTTNQIQFVCRDTATGSSFSVTATPTSSEWVHVCGTYNGANNLQELFFNAASSGQNTTAKGALNSGTPASVITIGAFTQAGGVATQYTVNAIVDDVRLYNRVLNANEIQLLASRRGIAYDLAPFRMPYSEQVAGGFQVAWALRQRLILGAGGGLG